MRPLDHFGSARPQIAVQHSGRKPRLAQGLRYPLGDEHRSVPPSRTAEGYIHVSLPLRGIAGQQLDQQLANSREGRGECRVALDMCADALVHSGEVPKRWVPVRVVEKSHVEHQVGHRRHAAGEAEAGHGHRHLARGAGGEELANALLKVVAGEVGRVDQHAGPATQRIEQLAFRSHAGAIAERAQKLAPGAAAERAAKVVALTEDLERNANPEIALQGLLVAEQPPGTEPRGSHFPSRNRIIAGLAGGTLVVEAAPKSGSLITARLAAEAGREVMAIPGSPLEPRAQGCNQLIREGAVLVQTPEDVAELMSGFDGTPRSTFREPLSAGWDAAPEELADAEPADIAGLLTTAPVAVDELIRQSGASAAEVQMALLELEISGRLQRHAAGRVSLCA